VSATVARMSPNPKRVLTPEDETAIRDAMTAARHADQAVRNAVLTAARHGASVRSLAEFTGMSTNTIHRWKHEATQ
jgi:transposase-like protein